MVEYLKYVKAFLRHEREKYGVAPFALDMPFERTAFYGMIEDDLGLCDSNSFYLLYDFNKRNLSKPAFKPARDLGNMDDFYYDLLTYMSEYDLKVLNDNVANILNEEQIKFYEGFLGDKTQAHITDSGILVAGSPKGMAYIYTNKGEINK